MLGGHGRQAPSTWPHLAIYALLCPCRPHTQSFSQEDAGGMGSGAASQRGALADPGRVGASQRAPGQGAAQGLSTEALRSMYAQCLKLAAENKITQKNTWDLSIVMDQARRRLPPALAASQRVTQTPIGRLEKFGRGSSHVSRARLPGLWLLVVCAPRETRRGA